MKVEVDGMKELLKDIERKGQQVQKDVEFELESSSQTIRTEAIRNAPRDTSTLVAEIKILRPSKYTREIVSRANYSPFVEFGTRSKVEIPAGLESYAMQFKGKRPGSADFESSLKAWMKRKGIPEDAYYPISRKILNEGTEAQPFMFPASEKERPKLMKNLKKAVRK